MPDLSSAADPVERLPSLMHDREDREQPREGLISEAYGKRGSRKRRIGGRRAGAPGHSGHVSGESTSSVIASRAMAMNSSPSPSLRSSYQVAASSSSASASASSASLTSGLQAFGDSLLGVCPVNQRSGSVCYRLSASADLFGPRLLDSRLCRPVFVQAEEQIPGERCSLVERQGKGFFSELFSAHVRSIARPAHNAEDPGAKAPNPSGNWASVRELPDLATCTNEENPNVGWGLPWRRRELNTAQEDGQRPSFIDFSG